jgi:hypothetical protein
MRRRKLLGKVLRLVAVFVAAIYLFRPLPDRTSFANFEQIDRQMSRVVVESILGLPNVRQTDSEQIDRSGRAAAVAHDWREDIGVPGLDWPGRDEYWIGDDAIVRVTFVRGRVVGKCWEPRPGIVSRLKHQWRRWFP